MIEFLDQSSGNVLGVRACGKLTGNDYKQLLIPRLNALFKSEGKLNLLFAFDDTFEGWEWSAAFDDAELGFKHNADFHKIALVGGPSWVEWSARLARLLIHAQIRCFQPQALQEAWTWVAAAPR